VRHDFPAVTLSLKMVVTNGNHGEILDTARRCSDLGVAFRLKTLEKLNCHQGRFPSEISEPDYEDDVIGSIVSQSRQLGEYLQKLIRMSSGEEVSCNCSPRTVFIGVDGKVFLCRRKQEIGDVNLQSMDEIWQSTTQEAMLAEMKRCQEGLFSLSYSND